MTPKFAASETNGMTDNKIVYIDSNIFIYAIEGVPETAAPARLLIQFLRTRTGFMCTSEMTLAEVLAPSRADGAWPLDKKRTVYLDLLVSSKIFALAGNAGNSRPNGGSA